MKFTSVVITIGLLWQSTMAQAQMRCESVFNDSNDRRALFLGTSHEDAGTARLHFLRNETKEIRAAYYQFDGNKLGRVAAAEMVDAARRGVKVRLLLDAWNPESWVDERVSREMYYVLMQNGVDVRIFNQIDPDGYSKFLLPSNYTRMHDKLLIMSSQNVVTTGDRNVQNSYFGPFQHKKGMKGKSTTSMELIVQGEELTRASEKYFDEMWNLSEAPEMDIMDLDLAKVAIIESRLPKFKEIIDRSESLNVDWTSRLKEKEVLDIDFFHDKPGFKRIESGIAEQLLAEIKTAEKSVTIYAPYTFFSDRFMAEIKSALKRKVKISLVLPSWTSVDTPITLQHFEKQAADLKKLGVSVLQHQGDNFMHAKMMIIDEKSVFVGSYNFNKRSELNDYESGFTVRDPEFVKEVVEFDKQFKSIEMGDFKESKKTLMESITVKLMRFLARIIPFIGRQL